MIKQRKINSILFVLLVFLTMLSSTVYAQYVVVGNAVQTGVRTYQLTQNANWQNGSVWSTTKIDLNNSFDIFFELYLGNHDDGADGIAFTLQPVSTNAGAPGLGLGSGGIVPSVIVEYDTYQNGFDPVFDHVAIEKNGDVDHNSANILAGPISATLTASDIEDGQWHNSRVIWDANAKTMKVYFDCELRLTYSGDIIADIFGGNPNVYYGFTAATGGAVNEQSVRDFHFIDTKKINTTLCEGETFQIDLSGDVSYQWSPTTNISDATSPNPTFTPTDSTMYIVDIVNKCQDKWKDTVMINVNKKPKVALGSDREICTGMPAVITAGNWTKYLWSDNSTQPTYIAADSGSVWVTVTDVNGCKGKDTIHIALGGTFPVLLGPDKTICSGASAVTFDSQVNGAFSYVWSSGENTQSITKNTAGTYSVVISMANGCVGRDTVVLSVSALPSIPAIANKKICLGDPAATFDAGPGYTTYTWSINGTGNQQTTTGDIPGNYFCTVTNTSGCARSAVATLTVNALPKPDLGPDQSTCPGSPLTVSAGIWAQYLWNDNSTQSTYTTATAGAVSVTITDGNGCKGSDTMNISVSSFFTVSLGADTAICAGETLTLDPGISGATSYAWSSGEQTQSVSKNTAGTYNVTVTMPSGCKGSDTVIVSVNPLPSLTIPSKTICQGQTTSFDAGTFSDYKWNDNSSLQTLTVSTAGNYSVQVTNANGCSTTANTTLNVNAIPIVDLGNDTTVCEGSAVSVYTSITNGATYLWNTGADTSFIIVNSQGKYSVTVTDTAGCNNYDEVNVSTIEIPVLDLGPDRELCGGEPLIIDSKLGAGIKFLWSTGETNASINVTASDTITLEAYADSRCKVHDTIVATIIPMPVSSLIADTTVCFLEAPSFKINAGNGAQHYLWENGDTTSTTSITHQGEYAVTLTNGNSCTISDKIKVEEHCWVNVYVPNAFTPNEDGLNDVFYVSGFNFTDFHLLIFDRWGELLFESYDIEKGWDGTYKGNPVQIDVYVWKLSVSPVKPEAMELHYQQYGSISVIR